MANVTANISKGEVNAYFNRVNNSDPSTSRIVQVLFQTIEADANLIDYDTLADVLAAGGGTANVEADFDTYARNVLDSTDLGLTVVDDTSNYQQAEVPDWIHAAAGGTTDNTLVKIAHFYLEDVADVADDSAYKPLTYHDISASTNGEQLTVAPATGQAAFRAS